MNKASPKIGRMNSLGWNPTSELDTNGGRGALIEADSGNVTVIKTSCQEIRAVRWSGLARFIPPSRHLRAGLFIFRRYAAGAS